MSINSPIHPQLLPTLLGNRLGEDKQKRGIRLLMSMNLYIYFAFKISSTGNFYFFKDLIFFAHDRFLSIKTPKNLLHF